MIFFVLMQLLICDNISIQKDVPSKEMESIGIELHGSSLEHVVHIKNLTRGGNLRFVKKEQGKKPENKKPVEDEVIITFTTVGEHTIEIHNDGDTLATFKMTSIHISLRERHPDAIQRDEEAFAEYANDLSKEDDSLKEALSPPTESEKRILLRYMNLGIRNLKKPKNASAETCQLIDLFNENDLNNLKMKNYWVDLFLLKIDKDILLEVRKETASGSEALSEIEEELRGIGERMANIRNTRNFECERRSEELMARFETITDITPDRFNEQLEEAVAASLGCSIEQLLLAGIEEFIETSFESLLKSIDQSISTESANKRSLTGKLLLRYKKEHEKEIYKNTEAREVLCKKYYRELPAIIKEMGIFERPYARDILKSFCDLKVRAFNLNTAKYVHHMFYSLQVKRLLLRRRNAEA
jgi:hypothetical protein